MIRTFLDRELGIARDDFRFGQPPIRIYVLQRLADTANDPEIQKFARRFG